MKYSYGTRALCAEWHRVAINGSILSQISRLSAETRLTVTRYVKFAVPDPHPIANMPSEPPCIHKFNCQPTSSTSRREKEKPNLIGELIRARDPRTRIASNNHNAAILLSQRQDATLILQKDRTGGSECAYKFVMVILDINMFISLVIVRVECVEIGRRVRRGILFEEVPGSEDPSSWIIDQKFYQKET